MRASGPNINNPPGFLAFLDSYLGTVLKTQIPVARHPNKMTKIQLRRNLCDNQISANFNEAGKHTSSQTEHKFQGMLVFQNAPQGALFLGADCPEA